jgi:hypothetical protein
VNAIECVSADRETAAGTKAYIRQPKRHVAGDVGRSIGAVQPVGEIQPLDIHGALGLPAARRRVQHEPAPHVAAVGTKREVGLQRGQRSIQLDVELRFDRNVLEAGENAGPFLERKAFGVDSQRKAHRRRPAIDAPVEDQMTSRRVDQQMVEQPPVGVVADAAGQLIDAKVGCLALE